MKNVVVVGSQWGDEGKGKIVDWLSSEADVVIRFQGGHNAGHTLVINGITYKPYTICSLADTRFGEVDKDGFSHITSWFNYKGLTYVAV